VTLSHGVTATDRLDRRAGGPSAIPPLACRADAATSGPGSASTEGLHRARTTPEVHETATGIAMRGPLRSCSRTPVGTPQDVVAPSRYIYARARTEKVPK
jgi:hypothetical protein